MKRLALALLLCCGLARAAAPGDAAPAFDLPGLSAAKVQLAALRGKVVYLDFWASWCAPCKQSFPWMNEMQAKYGADGLVIVAVAVDAKTDDARRFLEAVPANFTIAFDPQGATPRAYAIKGMPTSVLIGADGKVIATHAGFRSEERAELEKRLAAALGVAVKG